MIIFLSACLINGGQIVFCPQLNPPGPRAHAPYIYDTWSECIRDGEKKNEAMKMVNWKWLCQAAPRQGFEE